MIVRWFDLKEAAQRTQYSADQLRELARRGEIEAKKKRRGSTRWTVALELDDDNDPQGFLREARE